MITIGANKMVTVRAKDPSTGKIVAKLGPDGQPEKRLAQDRVERVTRNNLGPGFGPDSKRRLIVRLVATDQIEFKVHKCQRSVRANVVDLYRHVLWCQANNEQLRKARERKAKRQEALARRRLDSAERRLSDRARRDNANDR